MVEDNDKEISQKNRTKTNKQTMGTEFQLGMSQFWSWMVVTVIGQCDGIINATELYT